jgi:hypothetical protein
MKVVAFKSLARGSLLGFVDLQMDSGLILLGCTYHESHGKRWVNPPGRPQLDADKKPIVENGKLAYAPVVDFAEKSIRFKWSAQAVKAIDEHLAAQSKAPAEAGAMSGRDPSGREPKESGTW